VFASHLGEGHDLCAQLGADAHVHLIFRHAFMLARIERQAHGLRRKGDAGIVTMTASTPKPLPGSHTEG
jgi:hypothetical protein